MMLITNQTELEKFKTKHRLWQGIPGIERSKGGRFFATFYSGKTKETFGNYVVLVQSEDGYTWSEPIAVAYKGESFRCYDPCIWVDPLGRLWLIWSIMPGHGVYASICEDPDADQLSWSEVFFIGQDVMMNKPTVLSTGEWLFPIAVWDHGVKVCIETEKTQRGSFVYKTSDRGKTFLKLGKAEVPNRSFDEHMVLELGDGRLMMLVRTNYGIGVSYSWDRGLNWSEGKDSGLGGPCSRFFIRRLPSGNVLLVNHYEHSGRNNLTALLSDDDCRTWKWSLLLDERNEVSYPDATIGEDGFISIIYDRERGGFQKSLEECQKCAREILWAQITEKDIKAGKLVHPQSWLKRIISKLGEYEGEEKNPYHDLHQANTEEEFFDFALQYETKEEILSAVFDRYFVECQNMHKLDVQQLNQLITEFQLTDPSWPVLKQIVLLLQKTKEPLVTKPILNQILAYLDETIQQELFLADMADALNISLYYMCHLFKKEIGISIISYRNAKKLFFAKKLLIESDLSVGEIAQRCGFEDGNYFSKLFKRSESITPKEYRSLHQLESIKGED